MTQPSIAAAAPDDGELRLYTPDEAAAVLRCTASWLREQARRRRIPFTLVSGSYRFTREHLVQIIESNERAPEARPSIAPMRRRTIADPDEVAQLRPRSPQRRPKRP